MIRIHARFNELARLKISNHVNTDFETILSLSAKSPIFFVGVFCLHALAGNCNIVIWKIQTQQMA